jgi:hypothetical protein
MAKVTNGSQGKKKSCISPPRITLSVTSNARLPEGFSALPRVCTLSRWRKPYRTPGAPETSGHLWMICGLIRGWF